MDNIIEDTIRSKHNFLLSIDVVVIYEDNIKIHYYDPKYERHVIYCKRPSVYTMGGISLTFATIVRRFGYRMKDYWDYRDKYKLLEKRSQTIKKILNYDQ